MREGPGGPGHEAGGADTPRLGDHDWDRDQGWLIGTLVVQYGEDPRPFRPWAALPWVIEHCLRHRIPLPGL